MKRWMSLSLFFIVFFIIFSFPPVEAQADQRNDVESFVTRFYRHCLLRDPDPVGLKNWTDDLLSKRRSPASVAEGFVLSPEFINRNVTDHEFIMIMYSAFFDRMPDEKGYNCWLSALQQGRSRKYVLEEFLKSQEFNTLVSTYHINSNTESATPQSNSSSTIPSIWPTQGVVTSEFGYARGRIHEGIDIANQANTPVYATADGRVIFAGVFGLYGNTVIIEHPRAADGKQYTTLYAHLNSITVGVNAPVQKGSQIALMGATGNATGPHLHYEVRINNKPVNPRAFLP